MKKVLAFDVDQTLNIAKTPIPKEIADLLTQCLDHFEICPISGQKFDQFLVQIVNELKDTTPKEPNTIATTPRKKIGNKSTAIPLPTSRSQKLAKLSKLPLKSLDTGKPTSSLRATKLSRTASVKLLSLHLAKLPALKLNTLGIQIAKNAKLSSSAAKNLPQNSTTKSVAPPQSMLLLQA